MATRVWRGGAATAAKVVVAVPAFVAVDEVFSLIATGDDGNTCTVSFTATATTVASVTAGLAAAWNASNHPLTRLATASDQTTNVTLTATTAGIPFVVTGSVTAG